MEEYEAKVKANILKSLKRKAALGFQLSSLPSHYYPGKEVPHAAAY